MTENSQEVIVETEIIEEEVSNPTFTFKNAYTIIAIDLFGGQLLIPVVVSVIFTLIYGDKLDSHLSTIMFFTSLFGAIWLVKYTYKILAYDLKVFLKNLPKNLITVAKIMAVGLLVNILLGLAYEFLGITQSVNQDVIEDMVFATPILMVITTVILAPLSEEIVFRGALYKGLSNVVPEKVAIFISSMLFGAVHLLAGVNSPLELFFIFQYAAMGYFMLKSYKETNSIWGAITYHLVNNLIAVLVVLYAG